MQPASFDRDWASLGERIETAVEDFHKIFKVPVACIQNSAQRCTRGLIKFIYRIDVDTDYPGNPNKIRDYH